MTHSCHLAYIIGVALGDGNLSCPNGRATRLRVTCDATYPNIAQEIVGSLENLFPKNKISIVPGSTDTYFNISIYSNKLNEFIPWQVGKGSKFQQTAHVPDWIKRDKQLIRYCLKGLIQTDGSIYSDRGYTMINFTNVIKQLSNDVYFMIQELGYQPHIYTSMQKSGNNKYTVRLSKHVDDFVKEIDISKS